MTPTQQAYEMLGGAVLCAMSSQQCRGKKWIHSQSLLIYSVRLSQSIEHQGMSPFCPPEICGARASSCTFANLMPVTTSRTIPTTPRTTPTQSLNSPSCAGSLACVPHDP